MLCHLSVRLGSVETPHPLARYNKYICNILHTFSYHYLLCTCHTHPLIRSRDECYELLHNIRPPLTCRPASQVDWGIYHAHGPDSIASCHRRFPMTPLVETFKIQTEEQYGPSLGLKEIYKTH